jgi:hypothetical protein
MTSMDVHEKATPFYIQSRNKTIKSTSTLDEYSSSINERVGRRLPLNKLFLFRNAKKTTS